MPLSKGYVFKPLLERFVDKISPQESGCWLWTAATDGHGYGQLAIAGGTPEKAYRVAYRLFVGPIPDGLELDHLCRVRSCVNPDHLEAVTHAENARRGVAGAVNRERLQAQTHCKRGHQLSGDNLYTHGVRRHCRACRNDNMRQRRTRAAA